MIAIKSPGLKSLCFEMAAKPLTTEAIALTEKKMNMALDDIIKMSKDSATKKKPRTFNKNRRMFNGAQDKSAKVLQYMDSRSSLRQGALARRRSNLQGNGFPLASEAASKAAVAPLRNIPRRPTAPWNKRRIGVSDSALENAENELERELIWSCGVLYAQRRRSFVESENVRCPEVVLFNRFLTGPMLHFGFLISSNMHVLPTHCRSGAGMRQQGSTTSFRTIVKSKPLVQQQMLMAKAKTLDSLFACMKEQRMSASARPNFPIGRGRARRQQLGQGQYANY
ncbi:hypothetical protein AKJ16_DCAP13632 [Drosera capensis]